MALIKQITALADAVCVEHQIQVLHKWTLGIEGTLNTGKTSWKLHFWMKQFITAVEKYGKQATNMFLNSKQTSLWVWSEWVTGPG